jgi:hypothetical protein
VSSPKLCERPVAPRLLAPAEQLLIRCLRHVLGDDAAIEPPSAVDWTNFISIAQRQGVLHWFANAPALARILPVAVLEAARNERAVTAQRNLLLSAELVRLIDHFHRAGIRVLAFKGVIAAVQFYGDLAERPSGDLDLLVVPRDYTRAAQVLVDAGYTPGVEYPTSLQRAFSHSQKGTDVDLHWGIPPILPRFSRRSLWSHATHIDLIGTSVPTFDRSSAMAVAAINAVKAYWNVSLRQHMDVAVSLRRLSAEEWHALLRRSKRIGCSNCVLAAAHVSDSLFPAVLPPHIRSDARLSSVAALIANEITQHLFDHSRSAPPTRVFATRSDYDAALDSRRFGPYMDFLRRAVTPNSADKEWLELPSHLSFLYYLSRPVRLLLRGRRRGSD